MKQLTEKLYVMVEDDGEDGYYAASSSTDELAVCLSPGDTVVIGVYQLVGKQTLAVVASLTPAE